MTLSICPPLSSDSGGPDGRFAANHAPLATPGQDCAGRGGSAGGLVRGRADAAYGQGARGRREGGRSIFRENIVVGVMEQSVGDSGKSVKMHEDARGGWDRDVLCSAASCFLLLEREKCGRSREVFTNAYVFALRGRCRSLSHSFLFIIPDGYCDTCICHYLCVSLRIENKLTP